MVDPQGSTSSIYTKLHKVKTASTKFNENIFGNIFQRKWHLEARIKGVHKQLDIFPYSNLILLKPQLQIKYNNVLHQKSFFGSISPEKTRSNKVIRIRNFFHTQTIIRRRRNKISDLNIDEVWCDDEEVLKHKVFSFFKKLFRSSDPCQPESLHLTNMPLLDLIVAYALTILVSMDEVRNAIFSMDSYKAPGMDGFQPIFFKTLYDVAGTDVWNLVANSFSSGYIDPSLTETLVVPIAKTETPTGFTDFRPISLCNVLFKIISKVMVNRLKPHLDKLINPLQSSFMPNRGTADNAMITQEIVDHMYKKKGREGLVMFRIYFEKAHDRVDWNFLKLTLIHFGFPPPIVTLIMNCTTSTSLSMKWNGYKLESFTPTRGLRQGDPMSPYLFVLCMENLSLLIQQKVKN